MKTTIIKEVITFMKTSKTLIFKRQQAILQELHEHQQVNTDQLAETLGVSSLTIRRDLQQLAAHGLIRLIRGGANLIAGAFHDDPTFSESSARLQANKEKIARRAAQLIQDGDTILINSSSTAIMVLRFMTAANVTVITNNGRAAAIPCSPQVNLVFTGGEVHANKQSMVGEVAINNLSRINASKAFLGISGISARAGISTSILQETAINNLMIRRSNQQCYILADGSKVGLQSNFVLGPASLARTLITDMTANSDEIYQLREMGLEVEQVE